MKDHSTGYPETAKNRILYTTHPAIYTDYYELTMAQGYFLSGRQKESATFDYFFRSNPFDGGYVIFCGLSDFLELIHTIQFRDGELEYLKSQGFKEEFLQYLKNFEFKGDIYSVREGEIIFPNEPVLRVHGNLIETQILETLLLNILNFQSLIATKASRLKLAAGDKTVLDFGLRRSQGLGGIHASRAAAVGGVDGTSNVYSAYRYGLKTGGTMAHSWVQSYADEISAFRDYARHYPDDCILLVDTYDTLESGIPNAIKVGKELESKGYKLKGIRLDSGDLAYFARQSLKLLDEAGFQYVKIAASNQLDEKLIRSLKSQDAPIDIFGVGTRLVTGHDSPALDGVYKLSSVNHLPKLKISENIEKITLPGHKKVFRYLNGEGFFYGDAICMDSESSVEIMYHPYFPAKRSRLTMFEPEELMHSYIEKGKLVKENSDVEKSATYSKSRFSKLAREYKRFENPHIYKIGISKKLLDTRDKLMEEMKTV
ncbi:MAG: nicotinate phosphoribosyltransferase [Balneolaceae bacterium]